MKPGKSGLTRIIEATGHSIRGLRACWHHEEAFRQDVIISLILLALSFFVAESPPQWLALIAPLFLIVIVELLNSAVDDIGGDVELACAQSLDHLEVQRGETSRHVESGRAGLLYTARECVAHIRSPDSG